MFQVKHTGADINRMLREHEQNFEYAGGYTDSNGFVDLRCLWCGGITRKTVQSIRKGRRLICAHCNQGAEWKTFEKDIQRIDEMLREAEKRESKKIPEIAVKRVLRYCKECGKPFYPTHKRQVCCSDSCIKKVRNNHKDRRLTKANTVDRDITLEKVYVKDNGICYLCGKPCDYNDYTEKDGTIVAGNNYPSIEHVIPIARGGKHEWGNVRLAHRLCNSKKHAK